MHAFASSGKPEIYNNCTMDKEYYIVVNDHREGPFSFDQLKEKNLEPSTLVWTAGFSDWVRADTIAELEPILASRVRVDEQESAFGTYAQPMEPQKPVYGNFGSYGNNSYSNYSNWFTLAIIATVLGFLFSCIGGLIGVFGIILGSKAKEAERLGDEYTAVSRWSTCKILTIISFVLTGIGLIANVLFISSLVKNPAFMNL